MKKRKVVYTHEDCGGELQPRRDTDGDWQCKKCKTLVYVGENPTAHVTDGRSRRLTRPEAVAVV